jgi:integrase/recombinase XerD
VDKAKGSINPEIFERPGRSRAVLKEVGVHSLRHSYATHLRESGLYIRYIQELLGHKSSKTTEIYTHITTKGFDQIKSPFDKLDMFNKKND